MPVTRRKSKRKLAETQSHATLFQDDYRAVNAEIKTMRKSESEVIRTLVSEALAARRLRSIGRDLTTTTVKESQKEVVGEGFTEVKNTLAQILSLLRGQGSASEKLASELFVNSGLLRLGLAATLHVEEIAEAQILTPVLEQQGQVNGNATAHIEQGREHWKVQVDEAASALARKASVERV